MSEELAFALERSFLAREFLTWLWFKCEVEGGEFEGGKQGKVAVAVEDALVLTSGEDGEAKATLRGGTPTGRPEAANALAAGLLLQKARMFVARGTREWQFSLDGETLALLSVKVVDPDDQEEPEDALAEKLAATEELREIVDALFREFLALRLADTWEEIEAPRLGDWVRIKLERAWEACTTARAD